MHISHEKILDYLSGFKDEQRETIYKAIVDGNLLEGAFSTTEGKLILGDIFELIATNVINIVAQCTDKSPGKAAEAVYPYCMEIGVAHKILLNWAKILTKSDTHKKKIKEMKHVR